MKKTRKRAPKGWKRIAYTEYGGLVFTPKNDKVRRKHFRDTAKLETPEAYTLDGCVYVRTEKIWNTREDVRNHEIEHLRQRRFFGPELYQFLYEWADSLCGYDHSPFEIEARMAEKKSTSRKGKKGR